MIFTVHLQLLEDSSLSEKIEAKVRHELINIEAAIKEVIAWYSAQIQGLSDGVMGDKSADIRDVGKRIISNLLAHEKSHLFEQSTRYILVAHEFLPSDTAHIDTSKLAALITEVGGVASHAAILARSLNVPAITGISIKELPPNLGEVIVDGREGVLIVNPNQSDKDLYEKKRDVYHQFKARLKSLANEQPATQDGTSVDILTNIENFEDINPGEYETLKGIGLCRTEYIFMNRSSFPSEEEQYQIYRNIIERIGPDKEVTFRTIDVGGDKMLPYFKMPMAAAWDIENIARETDFISIGTNDLIQYVLGVDRNNARVADIYQPLNPAVIKVIHEVIEAGRKVGRKVSICGEMAGNFNYTQLLLGLGLRRFSMAPFYVNGVKQVLRNTTLADAQRIAGRALNMKTIKEIKRYLKSVNPLEISNGVSSINDLKSLKKA